jgi:hypothetical protein
MELRQMELQQTESIEMEQGQTKLARMKLLAMEITQTQIQTHLRRSLRFWTIASGRLKVWWRFVTCHIGIKRVPKLLYVRETVALGERRFVSVIQFERQRFLIGCSSSSVTLLSRLADESAGSYGSIEGESVENRNQSGEGN